MSSSAEAVLDASALLAFLQREPGAEAVAAVLPHGSAISAVNLSEVVAKLRDKDVPEGTVRQVVQSLIARGLEVAPLDDELALAVGFLRPATRQAGLSLGDRACLALGQARQQPVLTTDRTWVEVASAVGVEVRVIR